jgi:hypothetical protein
MVYQVAVAVVGACAVVDNIMVDRRSSGVRAMGIIGKVRKCVRLYAIFDSELVA